MCLETVSVGSEPPGQPPGFNQFHEEASLEAASHKSIAIKRLQKPPRKGGGSSSRRCEALCKFHAAAARSVILDDEISALQSGSSRWTTRAVQGHLGTTRANLEQGISEVQKAPDTRRYDFENNFPNILAELQVQKFEARHQKMTKENKFIHCAQGCATFARAGRTLLLHRRASCAQGCILLHEVGRNVCAQVRLSLRSQGCIALCTGLQFLTAQGCESAVSYTQTCSIPRGTSLDASHTSYCSRQT